MTAVWVKEHEPTSRLAAARLAQQYGNAHRGSQRSQPPRGNAKNTSQRQCMDTIEPKTGIEKELICYYCQQPGHKATVYPIHKAKLTGYCYVPREEDIDDISMCDSQNIMTVTVDGQSLRVLLDTGSAISSLKSCHAANMFLMTPLTYNVYMGM